ncbi:hypothetical protein Baya_10156 [Bagarius yarrelli]|uniref:Uncharacterized protein n=1 Tax=Bagarius yarrelli TaxID=175774 RepID=A0A556UF25_BAGYA|nr:hypothetical protein Baya_10156 [Bagarius yarrelli]
MTRSKGKLRAPAAFSSTFRGAHTTRRSRQEKHNDKGICNATSGSVACLCVFISGDSFGQKDKGSVNHNQKEEGQQCGKGFWTQDEGVEEEKEEGLCVCPASIVLIRDDGECDCFGKTRAAE